MLQLAAQIEAVGEAMPYGLTGSVQAVEGLTIEATSASMHS